jgi:hypothetical protein
MKISKILALAAIATSILSTAAYAGGDQTQRRIAEENAQYFAQKGHPSDSGMATKKAAGGNMKQDTHNPAVSQYPCAGCTYDQKVGGYVQNPHIKR